jgi:tetratricopeptide (TPR) repeat protein
MSKYNEDLDYLTKNVDISEEDLNEIIVEADKIISDANSAKAKLIEAYLKKVQCLQKLDKYVESKEFIDKLLDLNSNMPEAFVRLGNFYYKIKEYDNAIDYVTKAIDSKKEYACAYCMMGILLHNKEDYSKALQYHTKAIEIKSNYLVAYSNRGNTKYNLHNYVDAIKDYSEAIRINPNFVNAYCNRGFAYREIRNYKKAAEDFNKVEMDILNVLMFDEKIANYMLDDDVFFDEATKKSEREKIEDYKNIYIKSLKIISKLHIKDEDGIEIPVSHYTKKDTSEKLLFDDYPQKGDIRGYFRLNSINTSNDPEEGKTLFHYLFPEENISSLVDEFGAFAGCFIFNNDSLNQFRLYGKTKGKKEGTGLSIALNKEFFNKKISLGVAMKLESKNNNEEESLNKLPLFRCIYIDPKTNRVVSLGQKEEYVFYREKIEKKHPKYKKDMDTLKKDISKELENLKDEIKELDPNIVYKLLLNLRYLVKHAAFKEEQECRIIQIKKLNKEKKVKLDENNRLYVEYLKLSNENVSEICFAPKAKDIDKFKQHLARNSYNIKCYKSTAPLA